MVELSPQIYRLIDMYQLLLAQSKIHQLSNQVLHKLYEELQIQASLDGLTKVPNRRFSTNILINNGQNWNLLNFPCLWFLLMSITSKAIMIPTDIKLEMIVLNK